MSPLTPLLDPETYFEKQPNDTTLWAGVVFVAYVLAQILMTVSLFYLFIGQVENRPPAFDRAVADAIGIAFPVIIVTFVLLGIISLLVVAYAMQRLAGVSGSFGSSVVVAGWAYAPNLLVDLPGSYLAARLSIQELSLDGSDPAAIERRLDLIQAQAIGPVEYLLVAITVAWSVYILVYGMAAVHDESPDRFLLGGVVVGIGAFVVGVA